MTAVGNVLLQEGNVTALPFVDERRVGGRVVISDPVALSARP